MAPLAFARLRSEIVTTAVAVMAGAVLALAGLMAFGWLSARVETACSRARLGVLAPPRAPAWRLSGCRPSRAHPHPRS